MAEQETVVAGMDDEPLFDNDDRIVPGDGDGDAEVSPEAEPETPPEKAAVDPVVAELQRSNLILTEQLAKLAGRKEEEPSGEPPDPEPALPQVDWETMSSEDMAKVITGGTAKVIERMQENFEKRIKEVVGMVGNTQLQTETAAVRAQNADYDALVEGESGIKELYESTNWPVSKCYAVAKALRGGKAAPATKAASAPAKRNLSTAEPPGMAHGTVVPKEKKVYANVQESIEAAFNETVAEAKSKGLLKGVR